MNARLYVSDLDGTLLRSDATLSANTRDGLNLLLDAGLAFTIATARSAPAIRALLSVTFGSGAPAGESMSIVSCGTGSPPPPVPPMTSVWKLIVTSNKWQQLRNASRALETERLNYFR